MVCFSVCTHSGCLVCFATRGQQAEMQQISTFPKQTAGWGWGQGSMHSLSRSGVEGPRTLKCAPTTAASPLNNVGPGLLGAQVASFSYLNLIWLQHRLHVNCSGRMDRFAFNYLAVPAVVRAVTRSIRNDAWKCVDPGPQFCAPDRKRLRMLFGGGFRSKEHGSQAIGRTEHVRSWAAQNMFALGPHGTHLLSGCMACLLGRVQQPVSC